MTTSLSTIRALKEKGAKGQKLSIYIPTHPKSNSQTLTEDTTRFKNALQDIKNNPSYDESSLKDTMDNLYTLLEDTAFWKHQDVGLAIFGDAKGYKHFQLPYETTAATYLSDEFIISPFVIAQSISSGFYVLDINLNNPQLYRAVGGTLVEVTLDNMPESFQDSIDKVEYTAELQHQSAPRNSSGNNTSFHGHDPAEEVDDDTKRYLRAVAKVVDEHMKDHEQPLILAGTENRMGNLRKHLTYGNVLSYSVSGNHEDLSAQQLYEAAVRIATSYDQARRQDLVDILTSSAPELVVTGKQEILKAAEAGRVERLYLPVYRQTNDTVRSGDSNSILLELPEDIAELEELVQATLAQAGEVLATEIDSYDGADAPQALCRF